jgi:CheY-like chemotaxis protein
MSTPRQNNQDYKALIMVVDDNSEFLSGVELTLEMEGYKVWTALNGQHALDKLKTAFRGSGEEGPSLKRLPDLILADIMMPVMDGYALYERVRANPYLNHIPFIFLTAKSAEEDIQYGKELGVDDYLSKPVSPEVLLASVRGRLRRLEQQRSLTAQFTGEPTRPTGAVILIAILGALIIIGFLLGVLYSLS